MLDIATRKDADEVEQTSAAYLAGEGFERATYRGEQVWRKKGRGVREGGAMEFVAITPAQDRVHLEGWVKFGILPGVYIGEIGTVAIFARIHMKRLVGRLEYLGNILRGS